MTLNQPYADKAVELGLLSAGKASAVVARQKELAERGTKVSVRQILSQANLLTADQLAKVDHALNIKVVMRSAKPKLPGARTGGAAASSALAGGTKLPGKPTAPVAFDRPAPRKSTLLDDDSSKVEDDEGDDEKPKKKGKWKRRFYAFIFLILLIALGLTPIAMPTTPGVSHVLEMENKVGTYATIWREMGVNFLKEKDYAFWPLPDVRGFLKDQKDNKGFFGDWDQGYPFDPAGDESTISKDKVGVHKDASSEDDDAGTTNADEGEPGTVEEGNDEMSDDPTEGLGDDTTDEADEDSNEDPTGDSADPEGEGEE